MVSEEIIKLTTLDIGRGFGDHNKSIEFINGCDANVVCIQDIQQPQLKLVAEKYPAQHFAAMTRHLINGDWVEVGIAIVSTLPFAGTQVLAYHGQVAPVRNLDGVEIINNVSKAKDLEKVRATESRLLAGVDIRLGSRLHRIATTHGTWVAGGNPDDTQRSAMNKLTDLVEEHNICLIAGDFNANRGGEIYETILAPDLIDEVPDYIDNTLDPVNHSLKGKVKIVCDYIFRRTNDLHVSDVNVAFGISDHGALSATIKPD